MKPVRIGVVGLGNIGRNHVRDCIASDLVDLVAVSDVDSGLVESVAADTGVNGYSDTSTLIRSGEVESLIIATPHYFHAAAAIDAFEHSIHVLCEKPIGVHVADVNLIVDAFEAAKLENPGLVFGAMFQQRTFAHWQKIKEMVDAGTLGRIVRATWIITTWFRSQRYYDSSSWRATWGGEGGGVLLNQCPHNLDLYQWWFGIPDQIMAVAGIAAHHQIEVEDEVTLVMQHDSGMTGHFITSTAESPGTDRLEIVGENGRLVWENDTLLLDRNEMSMLEFIRASEALFDRVPSSRKDVTPQTRGGTHREVIERFARAIRGDGDLVAAGPEGGNSVMLANAALLSHFNRRPVDLPIDPTEFQTLLDTLIEKSVFTKPQSRPTGSPDMESSF